MRASVGLAVLLLTGGVAAAETLTGSFTYQDAGGRRPLALATVDVMASDAGGSWFHLTTTRLGRDGRLRHEVAPPGPPLRSYRLAIHAQTPVVEVLHLGTAAPFIARPGERTGAERTVTAMTPFDVLDFGDFNFTDAFDVSHFNVAQTIQLGRDYADARRAPGESDGIDPILVRTYLALMSYTDLGVMHLDRSLMDLDEVVLHEYAHHVQARIGALARVPTDHDGCNINGGTLQMEDIAWSEGFATYFAHAVAATLPEGTTPLDFPPGARLETPGPCPHPGDTVENFVQAALWDLVDSANESGDRFCGRDREVFSIFDRELDDRFGAATADGFANAWRARGGDYLKLAKTFSMNRLSPPPVPQPFRSYDTDLKADLAVWTAGPLGNTWRILNSGGGGGLVSVPLGDPAQTPVPGDYDGDSLTDLAVFDLRTAQWTVLRSASRTAVPRVWGRPGDLPIPGDYDGDGEMEAATYRPSTGHALLQADSCGVDRDLDLLGLSSDQPVVGDFDGDGRDEIILVDNAGRYRIPRSEANVSGFIGEGKPTAGDFDGDGDDDLAVYQPGTGSYMAFDVATNAMVAFMAAATDEIAVPEDYDGDGTWDLATWSPLTGRWHIQGSLMGPFVKFHGAAGDTPVPRR